VRIAFKFHKRSQLFIRTHNEPLFVVAMCVGNPNHSPMVLCATVAGFGRTVRAIPKQRQATTSILDIREWFIHSDKIMKRKILLTVFALLCAACAQTSNYTAVEAAKHVGETATVTGRVDGVQHWGKGNIFLNMGGKYPNQAFTAFIPSSSAGQFSKSQQYEGRTLAVSGKIALHKGKPEIVVTSPSQISAK
jgi:hypothetical protein